MIPAYSKVIFDRSKSCKDTDGDKDEFKEPKEGRFSISAMELKSVQSQICKPEG